MIQVTRDAVIVDGHHAVRVAAEDSRLVDVLISPLPSASMPGSILDLVVY